MLIPLNHRTSGGIGSGRRWLGPMQRCPGAETRKRPVSSASRHPAADAAAAARVGGDSRTPVGTTLQRLLRLGANRGARPSTSFPDRADGRIDGEFSALEGEAPLTAAFVEACREVAPGPREPASASHEWTIDVPEIGRVGASPSAIIAVPEYLPDRSPRAISADSSDCPRGPGAVHGPKASSWSAGTGQRQVHAAQLVRRPDHRTRSDTIITAEAQIDFVHENKRSFISQREVRGDDAVVAAVRAAIREEPDVLVIEDIRTQELAALALEAAESGRLVFAAVPGVSTATAIERLIELFPVERREKTQAALAASLRGMVSQVLLRKLRSGRSPRGMLINTPAVASLILEGKTFQLQAALESGRRAGMTSFAESLATLVREGTVHASHAFRKAPNREQFLAILRRDGVDTSIAERLA